MNEEPKPDNHEDTQWVEELSQVLDAGENLGYDKEGLKKAFIDQIKEKLAYHRDQVEFHEAQVEIWEAALESATEQATPKKRAIPAGMRPAEPTQYVLDLVVQNPGIEAGEILARAESEFTGPFAAGFPYKQLSRLNGKEIENRNGHYFERKR